MKKTFIPALIIILIGLSVSAYSTNKTITLNKSQKTSLEITINTPEKLAFSLNYGSINIESIKTDNGTYARLLIEKFSKSYNEGSPELPLFNRLIEMPMNSTPVVEIINYSEQEYDLNKLGIDYKLIPAQQSQPKCGSTKQFQINNELYSSNQYYKNTLVEVEKLGILRGANIGRIEVSPISYNPVTNTIRVITDIEFTVTFENADIALTQELKRKTRSPYFDGIYNQLANNQYSTRDYITTYPIHYVVISDRMFETQLQPFINWKKRKGFTVTEAYTDVIGTSLQQIKDYIQNLYNNGTPENPAPSFVLFVGDIAQIPAWNNGDGVTDRNYVEYTGDLFPEIFYGRFSAENAGHLQPYIDKTLMYEQYTMPNPSYLDTVVMVSGVDGSYAQDWGNGQINYGTINYFNDDHDIYSHTYLYPASGSASAAIQQNVSDGVTFGNYTAHCSPNGWADPSFVISDIPNLTNQDKYGLLIGNCCSSSEFQTDCFAEEIVRAENKGCVGYIGGSNSTYWDEDYYFGVGVGTINENPPSYEETTLGNYDRSFHDHGEDFSDWFTTMDQIIFAGNLAVSESGSSLEQYYWDIYNLMGDPSLMIYYSNPEVNPVTHDPYIMIGATSFTVNAAPYSYVAMNRDGVNIVSVLADDNGVAILEWDGFNSPGTAELVITAQNYQPWIEDVQIFAPDGPFCIYENHTLNDDSLGNGNNTADYDEQVLIDLSMVNYGNATAEEVDITISTTCAEVTIEDDYDYFDSIGINQVVTNENSFLIKLSDGIEDQTAIVFDVVAVDSQDSTWESQFEVLAHAPKLTPEIMTVDDSQGGNGNGRLDPGETAILKIKNVNNGHCIAYNVDVDLLAYNPYLTVIDGDSVIPLLSTFGAVYTEYEVLVGDDAPDGILAEMRYQMSVAGYFVEKLYYPKIGVILEDWETGNFNKYNWQSDGDLPWEINTQYPYEGFYDVISGPIGNNSTTEFYIQYEVMSPDSISFYKKVSSEPDFDFLQFYIDNQLQEEWSGTSESWTRESYAVSPGTHKFRWVYSKDFSTVSGADKAWIDYIELPLMMTTTVYAGPDDISCENANFQCLGSATNFDSIWWTTTGSGQFDNVTFLNAKYTPSAEDIEAGDIHLCLNIIDVDNNQLCDTMNLSFSYLPDQANIPTGPEQIDLQVTTESEYETQDVAGADSYSWEIYPDDAGNITGDNTTGTVSWNNQYEGEAWIKVSGENNCGLGVASDSLLVIVSNPVGIINNNNNLRIDLQPNPSNGIFNLELNSMDDKTVEVTITTEIGTSIFNSNYNISKQGKNIRIDLSNQPAGLYYIKASNSQNTVISKLIIVK